MSQNPVDQVDGKVLPPVLSPFRPVVTLHSKQKLANRIRQCADPGVVLLRVLGRGSEELNDRAHGSLRTKDRPVRTRIGKAILVNQRKILLQYLGDLLDIVLIIAHKDRPFEDYVGDRLRDFRLAAARDGTRLVTKSSPRARTDEPPCGTTRLFLHSQAKTIGENVGCIGAQRQLKAGSVVLPTNRALA